MISGDVTDSNFCGEAVERTVRDLGRIGILVNHAAYQQSRERLEDIPNEQSDLIYRTNIYGYFYMTLAALPSIKTGGSNINSGSITGLEGNKTLIDYAAKKGTIHAFTKSLALNFVSRQIRVNCVTPGPKMDRIAANFQISQSGRGTWSEGADAATGTTRRVAPAFVFFASNADSSCINGEILTLLDGETIAV